MDKDLCYDDLSRALTDAFIVYQWRLDNPFPAPQESTATLTHKYLTDPIFHAKVTTLTAGIVDIVSRWVEKEPQDVLAAKSPCC